MKKTILIAAIQLFNSLAVNILLVMSTALIYKNQGSVSALMMLMTVPTILFSKIFGCMIDRGVSKIILQLLLFGSIITSLILTFQGLFQYNIALYVYASVVYVMDCFVRLYASAFVTNVTSDQHYLKFNSLLNFSDNAGYIIGPVIGGIWAETEEIFYGFLIITVFLMIVFGAVSCLKPGRNLNIAPKEKEAAKKFNETTEKLKEAAGSEKRSGSDLSFLLFAACIFAFAVGLVNVRQISFVVNHFTVNELGYSITESLWGLGLMAGCFVVVILDRRWQTSRLLGRSYLLIGFCVLGLFLTHFYFLGLVFYLLLGIGNMAISIILTTLVQKKSPGICIGKSLGKKNLCQQISNLAAMGFAGIFETTISSDYIYLSAGILLIIFGMTMLVRFEQRLA